MASEFPTSSGESSHLQATFKLKANAAGDILTQVKTSMTEHNLESALLLLGQSSSEVSLDDPRFAEVQRGLAEGYAAAFARYGIYPHITECVAVIMRSVEGALEAGPSSSQQNKQKAPSSPGSGYLKFLARYYASIPVEKVDSAIYLYLEALDLCPEYHPDRPDLLIGLSNAYCLRFLASGLLGGGVYTTHSNAVADPFEGGSRVTHSASLDNAAQRLEEALQVLEALSTASEPALNQGQWQRTAIFISSAALCHVYCLKFLASTSDSALSDSSLHILSQIQQWNARFEDEDSGAESVWRNGTDIMAAVSPRVYSSIDEAGEEGDEVKGQLDVAAESLKLALDLRPKGHPKRYQVLANLGILLVQMWILTKRKKSHERQERNGGGDGEVPETPRRYDRSRKASGGFESMLDAVVEADEQEHKDDKDFQIVEEALGYFEELVDEIKPTNVHPGAADSLRVYAASLKSLSEYPDYRRGARDLDRCIEIYQQAVNLRLLDGNEKSKLLSALSRAVQARARTQQRPEDQRQDILDAANLQQAANTLSCGGDGIGVGQDADWATTTGAGQLQPKAKAITRSKLGDNMAGTIDRVEEKKGHNRTLSLTGKVPKLLSTTLSRVSKIKQVQK